MITASSQRVVVPKSVHASRNGSRATSLEARCPARKVCGFVGSIARFVSGKSASVRFGGRRCLTTRGESDSEPAAASTPEGEGSDIYIGSGVFIKDDPKKYPDKEDLGFFLGVTGGFAGGETGLKDFVADSQERLKKEKLEAKLAATISKPSAKATKLSIPVLMPGMNGKVINASNPFFGFTGIVQRVSDGKVSMIFEGGCWDKNQVFLVEDVEKSEPPPGSNPKSAVLTELIAALKAQDEKNQPVES